MTVSELIKSLAVLPGDMIVCGLDADGYIWSVDDVATGDVVFDPGGYSFMVGPDDRDDLEEDALSAVALIRINE